MKAGSSLHEEEESARPTEISTSGIGEQMCCIPAALPAVGVHGAGRLPRPVAGLRLLVALAVPGPLSRLML